MRRRRILNIRTKKHMTVTRKMKIRMIKLFRYKKAKNEGDVDNDNNKETDENNANTASDSENTEEGRDASMATNDDQKNKKQHSKCNIEDDIIMKFFGGDLKLKVAKNIYKSSKSNPVKVSAIGPFYNSKSGKSHWVVVYGASGGAWMVKSVFIRGYLSAVLPGLKGSNIDIDHCLTYQDMNIQKDVFGLDYDWRRTQKLM